MQNQPVAKVKVGSMEVAVWENKSENKLYWNSVTIQRHYKSGEKWKNTNSFRLRDIKDIITALEQVNEKMRVRFSGNFAGEETEGPEGKRFPEMPDRGGYLMARVRWKKRLTFLAS